MTAAALALWLALGASAPSPSWATVISSLTKVRPGIELPRQSSVSLLAARGECEGFQVVALPPAQAVQVAPVRLEGTHGPSLELRLYREEYLQVETPSNSDGARGLWPDALIPVVDAFHHESRTALPADSTAARPLVIYVEACVPQNAAPGIYKGQVHLSARGVNGPAQVAVTLEVMPFALPATSSLPNTFGLSLYSMARGHKLSPESAEARALLGDYARSLLAHRLSAFGLSMQPPGARVSAAGEVKVQFEDYDRELGPFLDGTALPSGARFTTSDLRGNKDLKTEAQKDAYFRAIEEHFREKGWKAQLFFYAKDEPKLSELPLVLEQARTLHRTHAAPVLVTSAFSPKLTGAADILCPLVNCFFPRKGEQTCSNVQSVASLKRQLAPGARVWWYQSCASHGCDQGPMSRPALEEAYRRWPSYMVDHPATLNRAMGPLAFLAGVEGELYYDTVFAYNHDRPWSSLWEFGGNGDGTLFYPGTPAQVGGSTHIPVESLRLKALRDGLEDYEYLLLLSRLGDSTFAGASVRKLVQSGYDITPDPAVWEATRREMAVRLKSLWEKSEYGKPPRVQP